MEHVIRKTSAALIRYSTRSTASSHIVEPRSIIHALEQLHVGGESMRFSAAFHGGSHSCAEAEDSVNPLQQSPTAGGYSPSRAGEKKAIAVLRGARIGPRKLNQFVDVLRGLHVEDALIQCRVQHKKAARMCEKLLESAKANAVTNHGLDGDALKVDEAWVGKGQYLRRVSIHGRGRSGVMHKTRSHLTIVLKEEATPRKTKVIPMVQERTKWKRV